LVDRLSLAGRGADVDAALCHDRSSASLGPMKQAGGKQLSAGRFSGGCAS